MSNNRPSAETIAAHLKRIDHQHFFTSFDEWLALSIHAFTKDEDAYMAIINRHGPRVEGRCHPADHYKAALWELMEAMKVDCRDYLGEIYEAESITNKYKGQFFTPEPMCQMMVDMMIADLKDNQVVSDPSGCGSGRMLIAGIKRNRYAKFVGVDTDLTCVHMTALNILFRNANAYIIHGNGISLETCGGYAVRRTWAGGELYKLTKEEAHTILTGPLEARKLEAAHQALQEPPVAASRAPSVLCDEDLRKLEEAEQSFSMNRKGQYDLGF